MNIEKIEKLKLGGVAQAASDVWEWLSDEWQDQDDFDKYAHEKQIELRPMMFASTRGDQFIPPFGGRDHLFALQIMMDNDLVEAKDEDGKVWYRRAKS